MTYRHFLSVLLGAALATIVSVPARAQNLTAKEIVANVDFEFYVGETAFPAGSYTISARNIGAESVTIRPSGGKNVTSVAVITRIAQRQGSAPTNPSNLVFDKVGDRSLLSEVWIPGGDGYLVRGTAEEHQRVVVNSVN